MNPVQPWVALHAVPPASLSFPFFTSRQATATADAPPWCCIEILGSWATPPTRTGMEEENLDILTGALQPLDNVMAASDAAGSAESRRRHLDMHKELVALASAKEGAVQAIQEMEDAKLRLAEQKMARLARVEGAMQAQLRAAGAALDEHAGGRKLGSRCATLCGVCSWQAQEDSALPAQLRDAACALDEHAGAAAAVQHMGSASTLGANDWKHLAAQGRHLRGRAAALRRAQPECGDLDLGAEVAAPDKAARLAGAAAPLKVQLQHVQRECSTLRSQLQEQTLEVCHLQQKVADLSSSSSARLQEGAQQQRPLSAPQPVAGPAGPEQSSNPAQQTPSQQEVHLLNPLQMLREAVNLPALCPAGITSSTQNSSALVAAGTGASPAPPSPASDAGRGGRADQAAARLKQAYERMLLEQQARHQQERERLQQKFDLRIKDMEREHEEAATELLHGHCHRSHSHSPCRHGRSKDAPAHLKPVLKENEALRVGMSLREHMAAYFQPCVASLFAQQSPPGLVAKVDHLSSDVDNRIEYALWQQRQAHEKSLQELCALHAQELHEATVQAVPLECVPQAEVQQLVDEAVATAHAQHRAADLRAQAEAEEQQRRFVEALQARDRQFQGLLAELRTLRDCCRGTSSSSPSSDGQRSRAGGLHGEPSAAGRALQAATGQGPQEGKPGDRAGEQPSPKQRHEGHFEARPGPLVPLSVANPRLGARVLSRLGPAAFRALMQISRVVPPAVPQPQPLWRVLDAAAASARRRQSADFIHTS
eukprot:jgi/Astpho2/8691/fgenesh1_pg.00128_%23_9_t